MIYVLNCTDQNDQIFKGSGTGSKRLSHSFSKHWMGVVVKMICYGFTLSWGYTSKKQTNFGKLLRAAPVAGTASVTRALGSCGSCAALSARSLAGAEPTLGRRAGSRPAKGKPRRRKAMAMLQCCWGWPAVPRCALSGVLLSALTWIPTCSMLHKVGRIILIGENKVEQITRRLSSWQRPVSRLVILCHSLGSSCHDDLVENPWSNTPNAGQHVSNFHLLRLLRLGLTIGHGWNLTCCGDDRWGGSIDGSLACHRYG